MQASPTMYPPGSVRMRPMLDALARNWGLILLRGILAIIFGVLAFVWPGITLISLVLLYGAFAFMDGILAIAAAIRGGLPAPRWWLALIGIFGIAAGILTVLWPQITALVLLLFIAGWAMARTTRQGTSVGPGIMRMARSSPRRQCWLLTPRLPSRRPFGRAITRAIVCRVGGRSPWRTRAHPDTDRGPRWRAIR